MKSNIRIEEVGDVNSDYPYLEVFYTGDIAPFLEISINNRKLSFKIYNSGKDILLNYEEWEYIHKTANEFLPIALKNEDDYLNWQG
ncbi:hypothetical protein QFZ37_002061 [Chryseobacterium ginsenosidimutans]|uniref:hypothetical protein n=1 Tax=Chryseobacterium ginsenosidimutans TaxID=687846 RepID=UPI002786CEAC|nr:hypothetical protein [Chryseobacterium ginsenosidimutans]MDQ0593692.1 hypothetical protein [Chryseobacterium ginsenosidimutans]